MNIIVVIILLILFISVAGIIIITVKDFHIKSKILHQKKETANEEIIEEKEIEKIIPNYNKEKFMEDRFNDFVEVQTAYVNDDDKKLREKLTDELYNLYKMKIENLKINNQKKVMKNFCHKNSKIINIKEEKTKVIIKIELFVELINYKIPNNEIVSDSPHIPVTHHYILTFIIDKDSIDKCPNCGSLLKETSSQLCEYCHTVIDRIGSKWTISNIESVRE